MAVTGLDFLLSPVQHIPVFILMDRRFIDLNKHALDLNEAPTNDFGLGFRDASASNELGSSLLPKKGGWLELFCNMFGGDNVVLDGFPFASSSTPSSSNSMSQSNGRAHIDPRINSTRAVHNWQSGKTMDQKLNTENQSVPYVGSVETSLPQQCKNNRTSKLPIFAEFNHGSIFNSPISEHTSVSTKPFYNAEPGHLGCQNDFLNSTHSTKETNSSKGVGQQVCDTLGQLQHCNGLYTSSHPISGQGCVGSSNSHGLNHHKASLPLWDLNSKPATNWNADPLFSKAGSRCISQLPGKYSIAAQVEGPCASLRQQNCFSKEEKDCKAFAMKDRFLCCSPKKSNGGSHRGKALASTNDDSLPFDKGKGFGQRVRIIASPDWLPDGWITEVKTRMAGSTAGTTDKYYKDPVTGRRFRSKNEVLKFLETGRLCRNKPQVKLLERFPAFADMPLLLPRQERRVGLSDSFQATAAKRTPPTLATELSSQASMCQSICPPRLISDRISVRQEQDDLLPVEVNLSSDDHRVLDVTALKETRSYNLQKRPGLENLEFKKLDAPIRAGSTVGFMYQTPVHSSKRKLIGDCNIQLPSKRLHGTFKDLQDHDKWTSCMSPFSRKADVQTASTRLEASDTKIAHSGYPGLLYKQEAHESKGKAVSQYLAARYSASTRALGLYVTPFKSSTSQVSARCITELQSKPVPLSKGVEKKLTLKQERDFLISLGRKLCREFLATLKESCLLE